jgi:hypothetical protein
MSGILRIQADVHRRLIGDLRRPHAFAGERIAFCRLRLGNKEGSTPIALVTEAWPVADNHYIDDPMSGARINAAAIRAAMQDILDSGTGILHVHLHDLPGSTRFGSMDRAEIPRLVESFRGTDASRVHGMMVLSRDSAEAWLAFPGSKLLPVSKVAIVGRPMTLIAQPGALRPKRFLRQSFLGAASDRTVGSARVSIVGLSGGGSHTAQQLAHVGFLDYALFDAQPIEESNLNRLVGATEEDVATGRLKVEIAKRVILQVRGNAHVDAVPQRWQDAAELLRTCDVVFGCLDRFDERRQLEISCRRYLIPYIDIGMDVRKIGLEPARMAGQVILSLPGAHCMQCLGFLNERTLTEEAQRYGDAGDQPQVVWANGVLASNAVGIAIDLLTGWSGRTNDVEYLSYDGTACTVGPHVRLDFQPEGPCAHHTGTGDPFETETRGH